MQILQIRVLKNTGDEPNTFLHYPKQTRMCRQRFSWILSLKLQSSPGALFLSAILHGHKNETNTAATFCGKTKKLFWVKLFSGGSKHDLNFRFRAKMSVSVVQKKVRARFSVTRLLANRIIALLKLSLKFSLVTKKWLIFIATFEAKTFLDIAWKFQRGKKWAGFVKEFFHY